MNQSTYLPSKPRYEILDGLRGVAAMLVVSYHLIETYFGGAPGQPLNHGYLAVDFFFCLSGFVMGYAYDDRWSKMSTWGFFKRRIVRLHPMLIMGTLVGVLLFYLGDCATFPLINQTPWWVVLLMVIPAFLMWPVSPSMDIRGWGETYPLNGPQWSLMWEYLANILYAFVIRHFPKWLIGVCAALAALLTLNLTLNIDLGGILEPRNYAMYTVIGGWSTSADQLLIGATRLAYPFFIGLLISRMNWLTHLRGGFWWCSLIVATTLCMPHMNGTENALSDGIYQAFVILLVFPFVISLGAGSQVSGRSASFCRWLGRISFPLYITHYPLIYMQMGWADQHADLPVGTHVMVAVCLFIVAIGMAHAMLTLYDEPVREWLRRHWLK